MFTRLSLAEQIIAERKAHGWVFEPKLSMRTAAGTIAPAITRQPQMLDGQDILRPGHPVPTE